MVLFFPSIIEFFSVNHRAYKPQQAVSEENIEVIVHLLFFQRATQNTLARSGKRPIHACSLKLVVKVAEHEVKYGKQLIEEENRKCHT